MGFTVKIDLSEFNRRTEEAKRKTQKFSNMLKIVPREIDKSTTQLNTFAKTSKDAFGSANESLGKIEKTLKTVGTYFATYLAVDQIISLGKALLDASIAADRLSKSYQSIEGSSGAAKEQLDFIYQTSQELGLSFMSTAESAKTFFASAKGTSLEKDMNKIFSSVSQAGTALSLSSEQMQGVFLALGQMISKGKVQAEELRGQLGERLPGAFQLAATAMNKTTDELDKFMADGKLTAEELLPKLADALTNKYAASAGQAANGIQQSINKMDNEWTRFKSNLLDSEPVVSAINQITGALQGLNAAMGERDLEKRMEAAGWQRTEVTDFRNSTYKLYTKEQKEMFLAYEKMIDEKERAEQDATNKEKIELDKRQNARAQAQKAYEKIIVTTREGQIQKAKDAYTETAKLQKEALEQGAITQQEYDKRLIALAQARDAKIAAINKRNTPKKTAKTDEEKFAEKSAQYASGLEKLRNEVSGLESSLDPTLTKLERMKKQIEAERDAAILNADVKAAETVRRKEATEAQAQETAQLEKHKATLIAAQKLDDLQNQNLRDKADFYKQLADKTGEYDTSIEYQTQLLEKQRQVWETLGLPVYDINKMLEILRLEMSKDPFDGAIRGLKKYEVEAKNLAQGLENVTTSAFSSMEDAMVNFTMTGKASFSDMTNSIISDLMRIAVRSSITGPLAGALGGLFNFGGSTATTSVMGNSISSGWANSFMGNLKLFATGGVASPSWDLAPSGGILTRPTYFYDGMNRAYATGGLSVAGEAGPEVYMPAKRMSDGNYGVRVQGVNTTPQVIINVQNNTPAQVRTETSMDAQGMPRIDILIDELDNRLAARIGAGRSQTGRAIDLTRGTNRARGTY